VVSSVGNVLSAAVGESNGVGASHSSGGIGGLSSIEVGLGVVISDSVLVGVGCRLFLLMVSRSSMISRCWGMVGRGSMVDNRGVVGWGSMDNRCSVVGWSMMDNRRMVDRGSMISRGMVHNGSSMVCRGRSVVGWSGMVRRGRGMISRRSMISRGSMVSRGSMISRCSTISMGRKSSGGVHSS